MARNRRPRNQGSGGEIILGSVTIDLPRKADNHAFTFSIGRNNSHVPQYFIKTTGKDENWRQAENDDDALREGMRTIGRLIQDSFGGDLEGSTGEERGPIKNEKTLLDLRIAQGIKGVGSGQIKLVRGELSDGDIDYAIFIDDEYLGSLPDVSTEQTAVLAALGKVRAILADLEL